MSEIKVNKISPKQLCTQLTLGDSGDTIIIPAGATITNNGTATGFGRTGTVNWDTTAKTTDFTAVNGVGYFCNTTAGAFTMTLPATPSAGDIVALKDYANTFDTNNLTIGRNGSKINGTNSNGIISVQGQALTLIYIDATQGWSAIYGATDSDLPAPEFVTATGGTVLTCGDFKTHVFTGPGTFTVSSVGNPLGSTTVEYLVVAGGGAGGFTTSPAPSGGGGGGGAGGFRQNYPSPTTAGLPVAATAYPITVGGGGPAANPSSSGNNSVFSTITSNGGGKGGDVNTDTNAASGGSGGGAVYNARSGGAGNTPPTSPPQGNTGGNGSTGGYGAGAGGGAAGAGTPGSNFCGLPGAGTGGVGSPLATAFFGPTSPSYGTPGPAPGRYFAGGGGGGAYGPGGPGTGGLGGAGGGGNGAGNTTNAQAGTINTGGGGGGGSSVPARTNAAGGSGIVVIRYRFQ